MQSLRLAPVRAHTPARYQTIKRKVNLTGLKLASILGGAAPPPPPPADPPVWQSLNFEISDPHYYAYLTK